jgi:hypothetical protein
VNENSYQYKIERYIAKKIRELTLETYIFYCMFFFMFTGLALLLIVLVLRVNLGSLHVFSDPLFYLGIGLCLCISYLSIRGYNHRYS